jgi:RsmE family RNA methyltransferase
VNIVLFEAGEIGPPLPLADPRAVHILEILRRKPGDPFDAGIVNGPRGRATIEEIGPAALRFRFEPAGDPPPADLLHILVALPRPQTARKILSEATSLGVATIGFFQSEKGEPGYASSRLWRTLEWRRHLLDGASQAFDTRLPEVTRHADLGAAIAGLPAGCAMMALDNYEASRRMTPSPSTRPLAIAFGPERGWSAPERHMLRAAGFGLVHLGARVLRTETAVVAAISILKAGA